MRPEETQMLVPRNIDEEASKLPAEIYLIPESDGMYGEYWAWSDTPAPTSEHIESEAVKYVRVKSPE